MITWEYFNSRGVADIQINVLPDGYHLKMLRGDGVVIDKTYAPEEWDDDTINNDVMDGLDALGA